MKGNVSIIVYGEGGNGIRFLCKKLISLINKSLKQKHITYFYDYDTTIKSGKSIAFITISDDKEDQQVMFNKCDILLSFKEEYPSELMADKNITTIKYNDEVHTFDSLSLIKFNKKLYANMIALGYLMSYLDLDMDIPLLSEDNRKAISFGYEIGAEMKIVCY